MQPIDIKIWLLKAGYTQADIARSLSVTRQTVWKTVNGREQNRNVLSWLNEHGFTGGIKSEAEGCGCRIDSEGHC